MRIAGLVASVLVLAVSGCGERTPVPRKPGPLSSADVHGSARLSSAERQSHVDYCVSLKHLFLQSKQARHFRGPDNRFENEVLRGCDCIINAVEDRASKMQFLMVIASFGRIKPALIDGREPRITAPYESAALRHGMSPADFARARREAGTIASTSIANCARFVRLDG